MLVQILWQTPESQPEAYMKGRKIARGIAFAMGETILFVVLRSQKLKFQKRELYQTKIGKIHVFDVIKDC